VKANFRGTKRKAESGSNDGMYDNLSMEGAKVLWGNCKDIAAWGEIGVHSRPPEDSELSSKILAVIALITDLYEKYDHFCGIVFVEERVMSIILAMILQKHPKVRRIKAGMLI
jgi:hypothetical protein